MIKLSHWLLLVTHTEEKLMWYCYLPRTYWLDKSQHWQLVYPWRNWLMVLPDPSDDNAYQKRMRMRFNVSSRRLLLIAISSWFITPVHLESYEREDITSEGNTKRAELALEKVLFLKCVCVYYVHLRHFRCLLSLSVVSSKLLQKETYWSKLKVK